jgi:ketosteroid isomerase-like protein
MTENHGIKEIIEAHYAASASGDLPGMTVNFAPAIAWTEAAGGPYAGTFVGTPAIIEGVFARVGGDFEVFDVVVDALIIDESLGRVAMVGSYAGTHRATGKTLDARVVHVWTVEGGKITAFEQIVDSAAQLRSMS